MPEDESQVQTIKKHTYSGRPIGSAEFIKHIGKVLKINLSTRPKGRPRKVEK